MNKINHIKNPVNLDNIAEIPNGVTMTTYKDQIIRIRNYNVYERSESEPMTGVENILIQTVIHEMFLGYDSGRHLDEEERLRKDKQLDCMNTSEYWLYTAENYPETRRLFSILRVLENMFSECLREQKYYAIFYNIDNAIKALKEFHCKWLSSGSIKYGKHTLVLPDNGIEMVFKAIRVWHYNALHLVISNYSLRGLIGAQHVLGSYQEGLCTLLNRRSLSPKIYDCDIKYIIECLKKQELKSGWAFDEDLTDIEIYIAGYEYYAKSRLAKQTISSSLRMGDLLW